MRSSMKVEILCDQTFLSSLCWSNNDFIRVNVSFTKNDLNLVIYLEHLKSPITKIFLFLWKVSKIQNIKKEQAFPNTKYFPMLVIVKESLPHTKSTF